LTYQEENAPPQRYRRGQPERLLLPAAACCCLLLPAAACCCLLLPADIAEAISSDSVSVSPFSMKGARKRSPRTT
jgi:hypothetical protein